MREIPANPIAPPAPAAPVDGYPPGCRTTHHRAAGMPLSAFLTRLIWLSVLPLLLLAAWLAVDRVRSTQAERDLDAANLVDDVASAIDQHLLARIGGLHMLAVSPLLDSAARREDLYREAQGFRESFGSHVILADPQMRMLFNTRVPFGSKLPLLPQVKGHAAAPTALATGKPAVGDTFFGPVARETMVAVAVPALREGRPEFLLLTTFETRQLQNRIEQLALPPGWSLTLLDGRGETIARRAPAGLNPATDVNGAGRFVARSAVAPWSVLLEIPRSTYRAPLIGAAAWLAVGLLVATLTSFLGGTLASRRLARAVAALTRPATPGNALPKIKEFATVCRTLDAAADERVAAEAALRESQERLQLFIDHAPAALAMFDREMRYLAISRRWIDDYALGEREIIGCSHYAIFPELPERWKEAQRRGLAGEVLRAEVDRFERRDGSVLWLRWEVRPWHAADGSIGGIVIFSEDITQQQQAADEIRNLNADLERRVAERTAELTTANKELDSFAYAVSHDLRAPLRAMSGFAQALSEDYGERLDGEAQRYIEQIGIASRKMGELIDGILALSRSTRGELQRNAIDLSAMASGILAELARGEPERVVATDVAAGLRVDGDSRMIEAALRNLLGNAWKYTAETPAAAIRVHSGELDGKPAICVADNGAGFDMAHADHLFEPFRRLHRQDEFPGIGIGLATVRRIVHRHGGDIRAQATPGLGATFCFTLSGEREATE